MNIPHLIERARLRYGVDLTAKDIGEIVAGIGRSPVLSRNTDGGEIRLVMHKGVAMKACWWPDLGRLVTFLPKDSHALTGIRVGPPKIVPGIKHDGRQAARRKGRKPY